MRTTVKCKQKASGRNRRGEERRYEAFLAFCGVEKSFFSSERGVRRLSVPACFRNRLRHASRYAMARVGSIEPSRRRLAA